MASAVFVRLADLLGLPVDYAKLAACLVMSFVLSPILPRLPRAWMRHMMNMGVSALFLLGVLQLYRGVVQGSVDGNTVDMDVERNQFADNALRYEAGMAAPVCVAKGVDSLALKIRAVAKDHDVPILENPPLARALHATVEIDAEIPAEHYRAVAEVIGYVMRLRRRPPRCRRWSKPG